MLGGILAFAESQNKGVFRVSPQLHTQSWDETGLDRAILRL